MKAEIEIGAIGPGRIALDGTDVSGGVRGINLRSAVGEVTTLELNLAIIHGGEFAGDVQVEIPESTRGALIALGWTPPAE